MKLEINSKDESISVKLILDFPNTYKCKRFAIPNMGLLPIR